MNLYVVLFLAFLLPSANTKTPRFITNINFAHCKNCSCFKTFNTCGNLCDKRKFFENKSNVIKSNISITLFDVLMSCF